MSSLETALKYRDMGLSVIPLYSPGMLGKSIPVDELKRKEFIERCKIPIVPWKKYQAQIPTADEVKYWFKENPAANIGIITGKVSGIVVFDLDSEEAKLYADNLGGFPATPTVSSGKGYHLYMRYPGFEIRSQANVKLKIDIRADGGQIVAPPSIHGTGKQYKWNEGFSIFDLKPAECTPWMLEYLKGLTETKENKSEKIEPVQAKDVTAQQRISFIEILQNGCQEGERNQTAASLAGHLFKAGNNTEMVLSILTLWNRKNTPPLPDLELRTIVNSIKKYESKKEKSYLNVDDFLDTTPIIISDYESKNVIMPFGNNNLIALEKKMNGGLFGSRFYILGGIPSSAKTAFVNNIADNVCLGGQPVLFFSYDDGREEIRHRTFARFGSHTIDAYNIRTRPVREIEAISLHPTLSQIMSCKYVVEQNIPVDDWKYYIERIIEETGKAPVILVDYLRKLQADKKTQDERLRVDMITYKLVEIAKEYNTPVMVISELQRDSYRVGQRLSMASFKESGSIEYEASWLGILAAVEEKDGEFVIINNWEKIIEQEGNVDLIIMKAKRGTGTTGRVPLYVDRKKMLVSDRKQKGVLDFSSNNFQKASKSMFAVGKDYV